MIAPGSIWLVRFESQSGEFLRDVSAVLDPHDDLLTDVTAFRVTHRIVEIRFSDDVGFIHVATETSDAGFDSQDLECVLTHRLCARADRALRAFRLLDLRRSTISNPSSPVCVARMIVTECFASQARQHQSRGRSEDRRLKNFLDDLGCLFSLDREQ